MTLVIRSQKLQLAPGNTNQRSADYRPGVAARQPHGQSASWQRHPVFTQSQEHVPQLQVPQQPPFAAISSGAFFELDILFLLSGSFSASALSYGLTRFGRKPYTGIDEMIGWAGERKGRACLIA